MRPARTGRPVSWWCKCNYTPAHLWTNDCLSIHCSSSLISGDRHVSEIASMALDLLAGSVVFQIPHRPNARLNIRMGIHRYGLSLASLWPQFSPTTVQWPGLWSGGGLQDTKLLRHVRHGKPRQDHREEGGGHEDTRQRHQQEPPGPGRRVPM